MIFSPSSSRIADLAALSSAEYAAILQADYPCVKHFWPCYQSEIGASGLTDIAGGVVLNKSSGTIAAPADSNTNSLLVSQGSNTGTTVTGTVTAPNNSPFLLIQVAKAGAAGFTLGDETGVTETCIRLTQAATTAKLVMNGDPNGWVCAQDFTSDANTILSRALYVSDYASNTGMQNFSCNASSTYTAHTASDTSLSSDPDLLSMTDALPTLCAGAAGVRTWSCASSITNLYGAGLFIFTTAPTAAQVKSWISQITYHWSNGRKIIPPDMMGVL